MLKKYFNLKWIGENLGMILLIPTLIGGMWQILELLMIGTAYIRFFSLSQVVPDGLLILLILFMAFLISQILLSDSGFTIEKAEAQDSEKSTKLPKSEKINYLGLLFALTFLGLLIRYLIPLYSDDGFLTYFPLGVLLLTVFNVGLVLIMLKSILITVIRLCKIKVNLDSKILKGILEGITMVVMISMFIGSFFFIAWFHNAFLLAHDMKNKDTLSCVLSSKNPGLKKYDVLYFNDKYIFVRITPKKGSDQISVLEFSAFFDEEACM